MTKKREPLIPRFWQGVWLGLAFGLLLLAIIVVWSLTVTGRGPEAFEPPEGREPPLRAPAAPEREVPGS